MSTEVYTIESGMDGLPQVLTLTGGALLLHFALDLVPHGYVATARTIFREALPTIVDTVPTLLVLIASIVTFGNPLLFLTASFFGLLPDVFSTLHVANRRLARRIPTVSFVHAVHGKIHWLPNDDPANTLPAMLQRGPLLACEGVFMLGILAVLFG